MAFAEPPSIKIPNFEPRPYQIPFLKAMDEGCKRALLVWHRRAGKEVACFNWLVKQAFWHRIGTYVYFFPTTSLGRRILWDGANKQGKRFMDYIPKQIIKSKNSVEMKITLTNGSVIQIIGTDNILNVGINPVGCVFSEYSLQNPACWTYVRPILRENGGWAIFNMTPRGKNHGYEMYLMAKNNPAWFCQRLSITDTNVLTEADIDEERAEGMSEDLIQQEYYCSFEQGIEGAFYAKLLSIADTEGRITDVPYDPHLPVDTFWDLGVSDPSVILFTQNTGMSIRVIDMYHCQGEGLQHYARLLQEKAEKLKYVYGTHWAPHDIQVRELGSGARSRLMIAKDLGINFRIVPNIPILDGIEHVRGIFNKLWIDKRKCKHLLACLEAYHKEYNERMQCYKDKPAHDWSSHGADCARYMAIAYSRESSMRRMTEADAIELEKNYCLRLR